METGKLAVVTGSSSGIGEAVANHLAEGGWQVLGIARREGTISHPAYRHHCLDLSDTAAVEGYFLNGFTQAYPARGLERVALVNNAGMLDPMATVPNMPMSALMTAFTVNTVVPMWLMGFFLRTYAGVALRIVNLSSGAANNSRPGWAAYCATKAALQMAGRVFGEEVESGYPSGIGENAGVLTYEPGLVDTAMQTRIRQTPEEEFPVVRRFIDLFEEGKLQAPGKPASVIREFLECDPDSPYREGRISI
ncbi:MAG: SDR family NAD(P)-dependent oxidoreductase [bacterium]